MHINVLCTHIMDRLHCPGEELVEEKQLALKCLEEEDKK